MQSSVVRYLGMYVDGDLSMTDHINIRFHEHVFIDTSNFEQF